MLTTLTCPVCRSEVVSSSSGCSSCHLLIADVTKNQTAPRARRGRKVTTRLWGLLACAGIVAWCVYQLPTAAVFVVPAAVVGAILHVVKGRPLLGALVFVVIVAVAPTLFRPSILTDGLDDLGSRF